MNSQLNKLDRYVSRMLKFVAVGSTAAAFLYIVIGLDVEIRRNNA